MNYQKIVSFLAVILGIGLFDMKSVDAKNLAIAVPINHNSQFIAPFSSRKIAQLTEASSPLYGSWILTFSADGIVHQGVLVMEGYYGVLRVSYFDPNLGKQAAIDQYMELKSSSKGLILLGYNPVYAGTSVSHPTYIADNFLFSIQPDGSLVVVTCDARERCSSVDIEAMK
ncbi:hypothetical protein H6F32_12980 [Anabaena sp. FACHB-1237]|uniref:hypothetical protein n=1 Tax=Anabaena sp. FACHB-1237 TaxID=2692769 RepID=UPI001680A0B8|nr:hypothetical protein [Anabaena sp. FACHB-1237]MBD2138483.1 hypothetical protein [Anabaena sp. FACHB-1237]